MQELIERLSALTGVSAPDVERHLLAFLVRQIEGAAQVAELHEEERAALTYSRWRRSCFP